nr:reverse transcriptase domain-containing protein [Tanacetum cinerariifolium]
MRTRNSYFPNNSSVTILRRRNKRRTPNVVEPELRAIVEVAPMADNQTMKELLQAPTEGYGEAIVIPEINADHFEIKTNLLQLVQANPYHSFDRENPHTHINNFKRITSTLKFRDVPNDEDLVNKFVNQFFPPSKTTHLKNEISQFTQRFEKAFGEAWERYKEMHRACPHHEFTELTQIDTFYNGLNENDQDSLNAVAGGNLLNQISTLVDIVSTKVVTPATVKAVKESCVTCGGNHAYYNCDATNSNQLSVCVAMGTYNQVSPQNRARNYMAPPSFATVQNGQNRFNQNQGQGNNFNWGNNFHASTSGTLPSNTIPNSKGEMKAITTRSVFAYEGPSIPTNPSPKKVVERETEETTNKEQTNFQGSTAHIQPPVVPILEPNVSKTLPKPNIPYPLRLNNQKLRKKTTNQMEKFFQVFQDLHFDISFADALLLMPKFASTIKSLLENKDKLFELAKISLNENCSVMLLKKLLEKLGDPEKFLIPCDFPGMDVCHALVDLGAGINLMPLSIWKKLSLPELTPTKMTLELADRSITRPKGVAEVVFVKVGKFHFHTDFVVFDFEADPRVPLILGRSFLRTCRALIDVYGEEITLRVNDEAEMLGFSNNSLGGHPTSTSKPIIFYSSPSITPFEGSDFILEKIKAYLKDESISPKINHDDCDPVGDIFLIEKLLNGSPFQIPSIDLKQGEVAKAKSSIEEPPELELKDLPSHLEYAYLEGADKLLVIISKDLKDDEKEALLKEDYKPAVQSQRRVNLKILEVIKKEVNKLLDAGMIYPISDSPWMDFFVYFQIPINPPDQEKTTFTCPYGTFAYRRMPFGLCNAPGTFQRCMMEIFHDMIEKTIEVFMDDFLVFGDSFSSCLSHLDTLLQRCEDTNLVLNCEKCHFMVKEEIVLGHKISKNGLEVDRAKVNVIAKLPHPMSVKACIDAFETLKKKLTEAPILVVPDWNLPFERMCDASDSAIGAVLGQCTTKHFQPIHYASKTMTEAQIHYTTTEKEMLVVVYDFEKFRPYPVLSKSIVYTDHSALKYLLSKQDAKPRLFGGFSSYKNLISLFVIRK